jgi:nickel transport protein
MHNVTRRPHVLAIAALSAVTCLPTVSAAHGIWIAQRVDQPTIVYGHGSEDGAYDPAKVTQSLGLTAMGEQVPVVLMAHVSNVTVEIPEGIVAMATTFDNGFWIKDSSGDWQNVGKREVPDGTEAHHPLKYNTHLVGHFDGALMPWGATLEIVPQADPAALAYGDVYDVQILLNGEPLPGVAVINDYINLPQVVTPDVTDDNGMITLKVTSAGLNVVGVEHSQMLTDDPDTDELFLFSTLSFTLPHVE